jgi:hypothetical protein
VTKLKVQLYLVENRVIRLRTSASIMSRMLQLFPKQIRQAQDLVDKLICAQAELFLGTYRTAFSLDVERLRYAIGSATCRDQALGDTYLGPEKPSAGSTTTDMDFLDLKHMGW